MSVSKPHTSQLVVAIQDGIDSDSGEYSLQDAAKVALRSLAEQLETLRRHDEAATQDAVFFRKQLVDTQEQLEAAHNELRRIADDPARALSLREREVVP